MKRVVWFETVDEGVPSPSLLVYVRDNSFQVNMERHLGLIFQLYIKFIAMGASIGDIHDVGIDFKISNFGRLDPMPWGPPPAYHDAS